MRSDGKNLRFAMAGAAFTALCGGWILNTPLEGVEVSAAQRPKKTSAPAAPQSPSSSGATSTKAAEEASRLQLGGKTLLERREALKTFADSLGVDERSMRHFEADDAKASRPSAGVGRIAFDTLQFREEAPRFLNKLDNIAKKKEPFVVIMGPEQYESTPTTHTALADQAAAAGLQVLPKLDDVYLKRLMERSLMIVHREVVEDATRTTNLGAWTFGHLMTQMANQSATGIDPSTFVLRWLEHWKTPQ